MGMLMGCVAIGGMQFTAPAKADGPLEFRVDNEVFREKEKQPSYETLTIFVRGLAYDFQLSEPRQTTIFDAKRARITLLDAKRQLRCTLETDETVEFVSGMKTMKAKTKLFEFAKNPVFDAKFLESVGE